MWIRSQSKKSLSNVNQLIINNTKDKSKTGDESWHRGSVVVNENKKKRK